jgi:cellulose synthase/poly-beta-1,6-N-acetylglucosamine synthase-like glycosyltransferase
MLHNLVLNTYFIALVIVGLFSFEAIYLTIKFLRHQKRLKLTRDDGYLPHVTVQLPVYNEMYVAQRLISSVSQLDYPREKLQIQVLDDSVDETQHICRQKVAHYQALGYNIHYIHRTDRTGYKAGALKAGLSTATGDLIAIFDADFIPQKDFLRRTVVYFADRKVGMVQTRWDHLNEDYSLITKTQAFGLTGHFVIEQTGRNVAGYFINFNGTAGVWRKSCIEDAGNWQADTLTEDLDLSYRAQLRGWKFLFLNDVVTPSELPAEINALKSQQYRWTKGAVETARKILPQLWKSALPLKIKIHSTFHLTSNFVYPFILILALLNLPLVLIKAHNPESGIYFAIFSFFLISFLGSFIFYSISLRHIYSDWLRRLFLFPVFMSGSMGFSINNTRAVIEGLFNHKTPFIRTPKYHLMGRKGSFSNKVYHITPDKAVIFELFMALYSSVGIIVAFYHLELGIIPFMMLFLLGFGLIGYLSIKHYFIKDKWEKSGGIKNRPVEKNVA